MPQSKRARETVQQLEKLTTCYQHSLQARYNATSSWRSKLNAMRAIEKGMNRSDAVYLARAAFELAVTAPDNTAQEDLHIESIERTAKLATNPCLDHAQKVQAAVLRANLPIMSTIHIEREQPEVTAVAASHTQLAEFMLCYLTYNVNNNDQKGWELGGAKAEAYSLLNLQRFQTDVLGSSDWTAVPSLLSEDHSGHQGSGIRSTWDISVFTGRAQTELAKPTYKVQVKATKEPKRDTSRREFQTVVYRPDISVVYLRNDLQLPHEKTLPSLASIGTAACSHVLDSPEPWLVRSSQARMEQLVDALDR